MTSAVVELSAEYLNMQKDVSKLNLCPDIMDCFCYCGGRFARPYLVCPVDDAGVQQSRQESSNH